MPRVGARSVIGAHSGRTSQTLLAAALDTVAPEAPDPYKRDPAYPTLTVGQTVPFQQAAAGSFLTLHGVTVAVVDPAQPAAQPWLTILVKLGWQRRSVGGVTVMRPARTPPR